MNYLEQIKKATANIQQRTQYQPKIGLILGSGLGVLADSITAADKLLYETIPHFPVSTVSGHVGQLVIGELQGKAVMAMQGRVHFYEGYNMRQITFPVRIMKAMGVEVLIVTNACGGFNPNFYPGALMFINDHINFMGTNPLIGENFDDLGVRFPDMSAAYDPKLIKLGQQVAQQLDIETFEGIYTAVTGPYYFSKAELEMVRRFGSDTIGMSTVPEVIVAAHAKMRVLGISCVTDMAIPEHLAPLDHETVMEVANKVRPKFVKLVSEIVGKLTV